MTKPSQMPPRPSASIPLLKTSALTYRIGNKAIVDAVSFAMEQGETRAIIGPNGAGKSTCVRCLCGILGGWEGRVTLEGRDIAELGRRELAGLICYLPQSRGTPPAFTVWDFVSMGRYVHTGLLGGLKPEDAERINDALNATGMDRLRHRMLPTLSGGELQMAAIAAGLAQGARLLVLDEPATFLDPVRQEMLLRLLRRLNRERGVALLMITHDVNAAIRFTDHTLALRDGKVAYDGLSCDLAAQDALYGIYGMDFRIADLPGGVRVAIPESLAEPHGDTVWGGEA